MIKPTEEGRGPTGRLPSGVSRKKRKQDPDPRMGRALYLWALQMYRPGFWSDLLKAREHSHSLASWLKTYRVTDEWLKDCILKTLELWNREDDLPNLIREYATDPIDFRGCSEEQIVAKIFNPPCRAMQRKWYVFDPFPHSSQNFVFEFRSPTLSGKTFVDSYGCLSPIAEWESVQNYRQTALKACRKALEAYTRQFAVQEYSDWNVALVKYARWTVLYQMGWTSTQIVKDEDSRTNEATEEPSGVLHRIQDFARHITLTPLLTSTL